MLRAGQAARGARILLSHPVAETIESMTNSVAAPDSTPALAHQRAWYEHILDGLVHGLGALVRAILNGRRQLFKRRLPDYVVIKLSGDLLERKPQMPWYYDWLPGYAPQPSIESIRQALQRVAGDPAVRGVLFLFQGITLSLAQAQSLAALFRRFHEWDRTHNSGSVNARAKRIVVYLEEISGASFAAAAAADYVVAPPLAEWDVKGIVTEPTYLKDTLARLGVEFDVVRVAPWKTAADSLLHNHMSEAERQQYEWLFDSLYGSLVDAIATGRKLPADAVKNLIDGAPLSAPAAQAAGLLDAVAYEDELPTLLGALHAPADTGAARLKTFGRVRGLLLRHAPPSALAAVGVISLRGSIMTGPSRSSPVPLPLVGEETLGSATAQQMIRAAARDDSLAAVVVHVDSPGGSALASDLIWRDLAQLDLLKPVVVYMGDVAASGGYYIAAPGRKIVAQPATLTGSIGVIMAKAVTAGAYAKVDAGWDTVQRGAHADLYSSLKPWQGEQRAAVEQNLDHVYCQFKQRVVEGRKLPPERLDDLAGGRVWTGEQALANDLVDELGDFDVAVQAACAAADLPTDGSVPLVPISAPGRLLLAEPVQAAKALLGLFTRGQALLLADQLPKVRG
jgi:protease-4